MYPHIFPPLDSQSPNSRQSAGFLAQKYGLRRLEQVKVFLHALPREVPETRRLKILSQMCDLPMKKTAEMVEDLNKLAPQHYSGTVPGKVTEIICPPITHCLNGCKYRKTTSDGKKGDPVILRGHRKPTEAALCTAGGSVVNLGVFTHRCTACKSRFGYQDWTESGSYRFYDQQREYVQVSQHVYVPRKFASQIANLVSNGHTTYEGIAASYQNSFDGFEGFTSKLASDIYLLHEIESDLTERGLRDFKFSFGARVFQYIPYIVPQIFAGVYSHACSEQCRSLGCGTLYTADGLWKMGFRHCKATIVNTVNSMPLIRFPNVCTNGCHGLSEYCKEHKWMENASQKFMTPELEKELLIAGASKVVESLTNDINAILSGELDESATVYGCNDFDPNKQCIKNKGADGRAYNYSRGYVFVVRSTGHIDPFAPIFRAKSLGQVSLFLVTWLYQVLQSVPEQDWDKIFPAYDNMCQLTRLRAAREVLPLPSPYDQMWTRISKIVDGLHIRNHKDKRCKVLYNPDLYYVQYPDAKADKSRNTMSAEQTFAWLANFRKQINAMPKDRQIFFIHRLIVRRNEYLSKCVAKSKKPVGGSVRTFHDRGNRA